MHPKIHSFPIRDISHRFHSTSELTQGRKNPIINIALIGPDRTPKRDRVACKRFPNKETRYVTNIHTTPKTSARENE